MELKPGYKQTEVGIIPEDWFVKPIEEIAFVTTGGKNTQDRKVDGQYPFFVRSQTVEYIDSYSFDGEAVLTAGDGVGTGKVFHYINGKFDVHQRVYQIYNFAEDVDGYFFYLYFSINFYNRIMQMTAKSSVDSVRKDMITRMLVPLPATLEEQRAIATALSDVDALLDGLDRLIAKKRDIKQAAMQQLLTSKTRLPGFKGEWGVKRLDEIAETDPENLDSSTHPGYSFNYIALEDVDQGRLVGYSEQNFGTAPSRARRKLRNRDILISTVRPNLKSHLFFNKPDGEWVCSTGFCVVRCHEGFSDPEYLYQQIFACTINKQIDMLIAGSNYPAINNKDVSALLVPIPGLREQQAIADALRDMDAEIQALEKRRAKTLDLKQAMMQELLTGRIRLVEPGDSIGTVSKSKLSGRRHNWAFNEAVVIALLAKHFGSEKYPLSRIRYTKLAYLLHRHVESVAEGYLKKAAGPYNPKTRYGGPERIAQEKRYIRKHHNGRYSGFVVADNIDQAEGYFEKWYGLEVIQWLKQFYFLKTEALGLLTTVDMACQELRAAGRRITLKEVKDLIASDKEWKAKLNQPVFNDMNISKAIKQSQVLFGFGACDDSSD